MPDAPGEAISRFRGDVDEIRLFALWFNDLLASVVCGVSGKMEIQLNSLELVDIFFFNPLQGPARGTKARLLQGIFRWLAG